MIDLHTAVQCLIMKYLAKNTFLLISIKYVPQTYQYSVIYMLHVVQIVQMKYSCKSLSKFGSLWIRLQYIY
jgi:hypothetical protein